MKQISLNDTDVSLVDQGKGPPLLLAHGFPLDHTMWQAQIAALSESHRVIAPDLRGYGHTSLGEVDPAEGVSMAAYADDLARLLDRLEITQPALFVGFSMGGYIAWRFLERHRERLAGLVLCDTRAAADTPEAREMRLKIADHVEQWGAGRVAEAMAPKLFSPHTLRNRRELVDATCEVIRRTDPRAIAAAQRGMAARPDASDQLPEIDLPTLAIVGQEDLLSPPDEMQAIADAIPNASLTIIEGAGHMTPVENPDAVNAAMLRFLKAERSRLL